MKKLTTILLVLSLFLVSCQSAGCTQLLNPTSAVYAIPANTLTVEPTPI